MRFRLPRQLRKRRPLPARPPGAGPGKDRGPEGNKVQEAGPAKEVTARAEEDFSKST